MRPDLPLLQRGVTLAPTLFPSLLLRVRRRSRGAATSAAYPAWCPLNALGRRRMRLQMRLGPASSRAELAPAYLWRSGLAGAMVGLITVRWVTESLLVLAAGTVAAERAALALGCSGNVPMAGCLEWGDDEA